MGRVKHTNEIEGDISMISGKVNCTDQETETTKTEKVSLYMGMALTHFEKCFLKYRISLYKI